MNHTLFSKTTNVSKLEIVIDPIDHATDMISVEQDFMEIEENYNNIDRSVTSLENLNKIITCQKKVVTEGNDFNYDTVKMTSIALESLYETLGCRYNINEFPSMENFKSDPTMSTEISMEGTKNVFTKAWETVIKFIKKIIQSAKVFIVKIIKKFSFIDSQISELQKEIKNIKSNNLTSNETTLTAGSLASNYSLLLEATKSTDINHGIVMSSLLLAMGGNFSKDKDSVIKELESYADNFSGFDSVTHVSFITSWKILVQRTANPHFDEFEAYKETDYMIRNMFLETENDKTPTLYMRTLTAYGNKAKVLYALKDTDTGKYTKFVTGTQVTDNYVAEDGDIIVSVSLDDIEDVLDFIKYIGKLEKKNESTNSKYLTSMVKLLEDISKKANKMDIEDSEKLEIKNYRDLMSSMAMTAASNRSTSMMNTLKAMLSGISCCKLAISKYG